MTVALLNALKYLPASLGIKALEKFNPKFRNYFTEVAAYGLDANRALDYISERFGNPSQQEFEQHLEEGNLRPDEMAAREQLRPGQQVVKGLKTAAAFGGPALLGRPGQQTAKSGAVSPSQILPAQQGPAQISGPPNRPMLGGPTAQAKAGPGAQQTKQPIQPSPGVPTGGATPFDFLSQYDPQLAHTLALNVQHGMPPAKAAAHLKNVQRFQSTIDQIENDIGAPFEDFISQAFGGGRKNAARATQGQQGMAQQAGQQQQGNANAQARMQQMQGMIDQLKNLRQRNG